MQRWMLGRNLVGQTSASIGRYALVFLVPALMVGASACGSSGDDAPVDPGPIADASSEQLPDGGGDGSKPDAADGDSGPTGCVPKTCATLEANCGSAPDGCGGKIECGQCADGQICGGDGPNKCGANECSPKSCVQVGASCGYASDGCSAAIDCGGCPLPASCGGSGTANQCGCAPKTCAQLGANCGTLPDGCFDTVNCGNCLAGQTCGGGGANKCGTSTCTPKTCSQVNASCGFVSDGCSDALECGECTDPAVCGGGGVANQCGCTPKTCSQLGASCGQVDNGCETVNCGECTAPDTCGGGNIDNQCGCLCSLDHAQTNCLQGVCSIKECDAGWGDCDSSPTNGCEVDLRNNSDNCGACGQTCSFAHATGTCQLSNCELAACDQDYDNCDNDATTGCEVNLQADPNNCNTCGNICPDLGGTPACTAGACTVSNCSTGKGDCDPGVPGCETDTTSTLEHCGFCNNPCEYTNATGRCVASSCQLDTCNTGYGDCDANESNGCEINTDTSVLNCGACDNACPTPPHASPVCAGGTCGFTCDTGWGDCDGQAGNGCEVNTATSASDCGGCGNACSLAHATASCVASSCAVATCDSGYEDCNGVPSDGCEINTTNTVSDCGGCGQACSNNNGTPSCSSSTCSIVCNSGFQNCDGQISNGCEVNTNTNADNCGTCNTVCSNNHMQTRTCAAGVCNGTCAAGYGDCNNNKRTDGCEVTLATNPDNCGTCGIVCSNNHMQNRTCAAGVCNGTCSAGYTDCNNNKQTDGCEINVNTDPLNCGGCTRTCSSSNMATVTCGAGTCNGTCSTGYADCNSDKLVDGCEANTANDPNNCGGCNLYCNNTNIPVRTCAAGICNGACATGFADCDGNKLSTGCEVNLTNDAAHCGSCTTNCNVPAQANVQNAQCLTSACQVQTCTSGYYNQDGLFSGGCECSTDTVGNVVGSPTNLGTIAQSSTSTFPSASGTYNITPTGGTNDEDWFTVTFDNAAACTFRPKIVLQDVSGLGQIQMQVYTTAGAAATMLTCNGTGESGNASTMANLRTWEFTYSGTCGNLANADPYPDTGVFYGNGMINSFAIRVFKIAAGASTSCLPYRLVVSNGI